MKTDLAIINNKESYTIYRGGPIIIEEGECACLVPSFSKFSPLVFIRLPFYFYFPTPWWTVSVRPNYGGVTTPVSYRERDWPTVIFDRHAISQQTMFFLFLLFNPPPEFGIFLSAVAPEHGRPVVTVLMTPQVCRSRVPSRCVCSNYPNPPPPYTQVHNWKEFYGGTSRLILFYIWFRTKNPSAKPSLCSRVVLLCSFSLTVIPHDSIHGSSSRRCCFFAVQPVIEGGL